MSPRLQDLSREEAFGHEARMILRSAPMLVLSPAASPSEGSDYFKNCFDFVHLLCEVALGNVSLSAARRMGRTFDEALSRAELFEEKSKRLAYAVLLVTDALGQLGQVRYFEKPGLSDHERRNPDAAMLLAECGEVISRFGMIPETLVEPAQIDFDILVQGRDRPTQYVSPEFFSRPLWPDEKVFSLNHKGMLPGMEMLLNEWENRLGDLNLSGVVSSHRSHLDGLYLTQAHPPRGNDMATEQILFFASNPKGTDPLRLDEEIREIDEGLRRAKHRDHFQLSQKWAVRADDLRRGLLDETPSIVHFSGHGSQSGSLVFENDSGEAEVVSPKALADLFALFSSSVKCVVLNACYSEDQADAIAQHVEYVVCMSKAIGDAAAIKFAIGFYDALGAGRSFNDAFKFGCNAIDLTNIPESQTPKLKK